MTRETCRRPVVRGLLVVGLLVSAFSLAAAGCGGGSSESSQANEKYADSVCTAIGSWEQEVKSIATDLSGGISVATVQEKAGQVETATKNLAKEIKSIPPPKTSEGQAAKQQLDQLSSDVTSTVQAVKSGIAEIQGSPTAATITAVVAVLAPQLKSLADTAQSAVTSLQQAKGSLAKAFKSTDSCTSLTPG